RRPAARQRHYGPVGVWCPRPFGVRRCIGVVRRRLVAGAAAERVAQTDEDHDREHQEQQCINVEGFTHAFALPLPGFMDWARDRCGLSRRYIGARLELCQREPLVRAGIPPRATSTQLKALPGPKTTLNASRASSGLAAIVMRARHA